MILNALGSRVIVDPTQKKVTGVEYIKDGQTRTVKVNREVRLFIFIYDSDSKLFVTNGEVNYVIEIISCSCFFTSPVITKASLFLNGIWSDLRVNLFYQKSRKYFKCL